VPIGAVKRRAGRQCQVMAESRSIVRTATGPAWTLDRLF
jgi:hypothetical protein